MLPRVRTSTPLAASLYANEVPRLLPRARTGLLTSSGEDKHPSGGFTSCKRSPLPASSWKDRPACFLERGQAFIRLHVHRVFCCSSCEDQLCFCFCLLSDSARRDAPLLACVSGLCPSTWLLPTRLPLFRLAAPTAQTSSPLVLSGAPFCASLA